MGLHEVSCNLCETKTLHNAKNGAEAEAKHKSGAGHIDTEKRWNELLSELEKKRVDSEEFTHGKDHNG